MRPSILCEQEAAELILLQGFFTLFWISIFIFTVRTYIRSIETHGHALNLNFAARFSEDAITLAISDFFVVLTTGLCVPFAKAVSKGWIKYHYTGMVLQHVLQTTLLFSAIVWTFNRCVSSLCFGEPWLTWRL